MMGQHPIAPGPWTVPRPGELGWKPEHLWSPPLIQSTRVVLDPSQVKTAYAVAQARHQDALKDGRRDQHGFKGSSIKIHREGALGELAVSLYFGVEWSRSVGEFHRAGTSDVAGYEVKTRSKPYYDLLMRPDIRPDEASILVIGQCPEFRLIGWFDAGHCKRPEWWQTYDERPGAWFVPQSALYVMAQAPRPWRGELPVFHSGRLGDPVNSRRGGSEFATTEGIDTPVSEGKEA